MHLVNVLLCLLLFPTLVNSQEKDVRTILLEFYNATDGPNWFVSDGWSYQHSNVCEWYGVVCRGNDAHLRVSLEYDSSIVNGAVIGIELVDNFLTGRSTESLWTIPDLLYVDVSQNQGLDVSLVNIQAATKLQVLRIKDTATSTLTGIAAVQSTLRSLIASSLALDSTFPEEIMQLRKLQYLHLNGCNLQGTLPRNISQQLANLYELALADNQFTGILPSSALQPTMSRLQILDISNNQFSGMLPTDALDQLRYLRAVLANDNLFSGPLPSFYQHRDLVQVDLQGNQFNGTIPENFMAASGKYFAKHVIGIDLSRNRLSGTVPASLDVLASRYVNINLADNMFDSIDPSLCDNPRWNNNTMNATTSSATHACDAIVCPVKTFSPTGRATLNQPCMTCPSIKTLGSTLCLDHDDYSILQALYVATDGPTHWKNRDNWLVTKDVCQWYGVECWNASTSNNDASHSHVRKLQLQNNGLTGRVPDSIYNLPFLTTLNLGLNKIIVPFDRIGVRKTLHVVNVAHTMTYDFTGLDQADEFMQFLYMDRLPLSGTLPSEIYELTQLRVLSMAECDLRGSIHTDIGKLGKLEELYLYGNKLVGSIPDSIGNLVKLNTLSLAKNALSGSIPSSLEGLTNLTALSLSDQLTAGGGLAGKLPAFSNYTNMKMLLLGSNLLTGTVPPTFLESNNPETYTTVDLSRNRVLGSVPGSLRRLKRLNIYLEGNKFTHIDPELCTMDEWMHGLVKTYSCDAILCPLNYDGGRQQSDDAPCQKCPDGSAGKWLGHLGCGEDEQDLSEFDILELLYNSCGGDTWHNKNNWLSEASYCTWYGIACDGSNSVVSITLGANLLVGDLPTEIYLLPALERLSLYSNDINFSFAGIENAKKLKYLTLDSTPLTSLIGVSQATALEELSVRYNYMIGNFPEDIARLTNLRKLTLSDNRFSGEIPSWLGKMKNLTNFVLANNKLSGKVLDFADLTKLSHIDLSQNQLTGTLPATLLQNVSETANIVLQFSDNKLTGTIPVELGRFKEVAIQLRNNMITGIPEELCLMEAWNDGSVAKYGCDGIMCPIGKSSVAGRQTSPDTPCLPCDSAHFMGSTACYGASSQANRILPRGFAWTVCVCLIGLLSLL